MGLAVGAVAIFPCAAGLCSFKVSLNVGGSSLGKTAEIRSASLCKNMRLCLFKKKKITKREEK